MEVESYGGVSNCMIQPRENPQRRREKVYVGCGAGFGGDRPSAALKLLERVPELNYLVLECLAERTLADRFQAMVSGGDGFDPRISAWMSMLLPLAVERGTCIITNMGGMDPIGAQEKVLAIAGDLGLSVSVAVAHEVSYSGSGCSLGKTSMEGGISTYLGAAPIVECLEKYHPDVVITSRVADASLFLAPMVYELGWNWDDLDKLAQGSIAGHLLECGCQLTGGYFMHPGDKYRNISFTSLLDLSLPYAEICHGGEVCVEKAVDSGGELSLNTCAQQLLYEVGDPSAYITPDVVIDLQDVSFHSLSSCRILCTGAKPSTTSGPEFLLRLIPMDCGWKAWGEISYGGYKCTERAKAAEYLVRSWMQEAYPDVDCKIASYIIGLDSLKATATRADGSAWKTDDIRLRMDGLFESNDHAIQFTQQFTALYTNGPAGGGGISTGHKKDVILGKELVARENVFWRTGVKHAKRMTSSNVEVAPRNVARAGDRDEALSQQQRSATENSPAFASPIPRPAPAGQKIPLYEVAHSRAGDKGNDLNLSLIPHFSGDIDRLKLIITPEWVAKVLSPLLNDSSFLDAEATLERNKRVDEQVRVEIYEVRGVHALSIVVRNILDGGVNCSRRIDRHGKTISDVLLCQQVVLPREGDGL